MSFSPEKGLEALNSLANGISALGLPTPDKLAKEFIIMQRDVEELKKEQAKLKKQVSKLKKLIKSLANDEEDDDD